MTQIIGGYWEGAVNGFSSKHSQDEITTMGKYPNAGQGFLDIYTINGSAPVQGQRFKNPTLAQTYSTIANEGCDAYYRGSLTPTIVNFLQSVGSHLTEQDFNDHKGQWVDPVNTTYRDNYLISELPPNPQGIATLQMLNMMELYPFGIDTENGDWPLHSADYVHVNLEIKKLAFADRAKYYADMSYPGVCVPVDTLISKQYAIQRNELINMSSAADYCAPGNITCKELPIEMHSGDTIYMTVADKSGMMASWIQSNYEGFGSFMVSKDLGFAFQDRGALFSLVNGSNNQYQSGKRPFHTIIPAFMHVLDKKDNNTWLPYMSFGVMGGNIQPQGHVQIVSNIVDYKLNVQEAGDAARWVHDGSQQPTGEPMNSLGGYVGLESGICDTVAQNLTARGHQVSYGPNGGGYQAIMRDPETGVYFGATEMRKDGMALGY